MGRTKSVVSRLHRRVLVRLGRLDQAIAPEDMNLPGFDFHVLRGFDQIRYTVHVNGPWCITFEFYGDDLYRVDLEQHH